MSDHSGLASSATVTVEISLEQLISAARALPSEARQQLREALEDGGDARHAWLDGMLTAAGNPVLAELWDNEFDAVYDNL